MKSMVRGISAPVAALAAALGLTLTGAHRVSAAPVLPSIAQSDSSPAVTILSPVPHTSFSGVKPVEISAFYQGTAANQIVTLELYVDGVKAAQKVLDAPETRGVVSFLVDASALTGGTHRIVVRAGAADAEVASAKSSFIFEVPTPEQPTPGAAPAPSQGAPQLSIVNPSSGGQVQGSVTLHIQASDPSGHAPYVSLFIDHSFKTLRNYAPYDFTWDTTQYSNGYHTIEAFGYNDSQDVGHAEPMRVYVNNPGGRTDRRTDLQDAPKPHAARHTASAAAHHTAAIKDVASEVPLPSVKARVKATAIARRPSAALLASTSSGAGPKKIRQNAHIAKLPTFTDEDLALMGQPELSNPFVGDTAVVTRSQAVIPSRGFKPMLSMPKQNGALMSVEQTAVLPTVIKPKLESLHEAPPADTLTRAMLAAPALPALHKSMQMLTTHPATPTVRVLRTTMPAAMHAKHFGVHITQAAERPMKIDWLRAQGQRSLTFNSSRLTLERPLTSEGSVMFGPLRQIVQSDGGSLTWQSRTGVVTATTNTDSVKLTMGQKSALVNQKLVMMDGVPYVNAGRTMVPLSFLQTIMNCTVQFDKSTGHLLITSNK